MRSISPKPIKNSARIVIYDAQQDLSTQCCICFKPNPILIHPCQCNTQYHQTCLLHYIRQKLLTMKNQLDFTQLRCNHCKQQIKFLYYENSHYSCTYFCQKLRKNWCNKYVIVMVVLAIVVLILGVLLGQHQPAQGMVYYGLLVGLSLVCLILLAVIMYFIQTNLTYKQIILVKVYQYIEIRNNTSSSEDSPHYHIASETFQIIVDQAY